MKKISKVHLDKIIRMSRELYSGRCTNVDALVTDRIVEAKALAEEVGLNWLVPLDFIDCIVLDGGLKPDAENEFIYSVLNLLGWEVA